MKIRLATVWLGGCAGCHMSFLDLDEFLIDLADAVDLVYSPVVDVKDYPENVDLCLIEGAVCNEDNLEILHKIRARTKVLVSFGDCAVTGNVAGLRNVIPVNKLLQRIYVDGADANGCIPHDGLPQLSKLARPAQDFVKIDVCLPGCPPQNKVIAGFLNNLLEGRKPETNQKIKFG